MCLWSWHTRAERRREALRHEATWERAYQTVSERGYTGAQLVIGAIRSTGQHRAGKHEPTPFYCRFFPKANDFHFSDQEPVDMENGLTAREKIETRTSTIRQ